MQSMRSQRAFIEVAGLFQSGRTRKTPRLGERIQVVHLSGIMTLGGYDWIGLLRTARNEFDSQDKRDGGLRLTA